LRCVYNFYYLKCSIMLIEFLISKFVPVIWLWVAYRSFKPFFITKVVLNNSICVCVMGQQVVFKNTSSRIVILTSYITALVLMAAYSAFLISSLAVQHQHLPFKDLQGLLHDGSYRLGVMGNGSAFSSFRVWERTYF
jgi:hypothetical protein